MLLQRPLYEGCSGKDVSKLQDILAKMGIYKHEIDGEYGYKTRVSVECIQKLHKLNVDGIAGRKTWNVLTSETLNSKGVFYTVRDNDSLESIAELMGTTPYALAQANSIRQHSWSSILPGETVCIMPKRLLYVGCGHLRERRTAVTGATNTGPVIDIQDDGSLTMTEGTWGLGIPVVRLKDVISSENTVKELKRTIHECQAAEVILVLPLIDQGTVKIWLKSLKRIRVDLGRAIKITAAVPIRIDKSLKKPGTTDIPLYCLESLVDYIIAMAWIEPVQSEIPDNIHLAPYSWVKKTIKRMTLQINSKRLMIGCTGSCIRLDINRQIYNWIPYSEVGRVLRSFGVKPVWDDIERESSFGMKLRGTDYKYYFEDSCSIRPKAALANALNLAGLVVFDGAWASPSIPDAVRNTYMISV